MTEEKQTKLKHNFPDRESWLAALNAAPNNSWTQQRSLGGNRKSTYLPIQYQQALQDIFFDEFDVIDEKYTVIVNEILCTVKCSGLPSYPNSEHRVFTGSGAKPIQVDSGSFPHRFPRGKKTNAVEYNAPAARSSAISNALSTIGNVFGRNLGRAISAGYNLGDKMKKKAKKNKKSKKNKK